MNLNWFKSSIKRYFEIDVKPIANNKFGLCENSNLSGLRILGSDGYSKCDLRYIGSIGICVDDVGHNKKRTRYDKNRCGVLSAKTDTRRPAFFISEVRKHYHNDIDNDIYSPLVSLGNDEPGYDFPVWRRRLGLPNRIDGSFLSSPYVSHLKLDSPELLDEIKDYQKLYDRYHKNIELLPRIIDSIVKSKFIERGVYPTNTVNYHNIGYYHFGDVAYLLEQVWDNYLHYIDDLESYKAKNHIATRSYSENSNILYLDALVIGNGAENMRDRMREVMNGLPQTQKILNALRDLHDN